MPKFELTVGLTGYEVWHVYADTPKQAAQAFLDDPEKHHFEGKFGDHYTKVLNITQLAKGD